MADTMKFGPEWLRALSDGTNVTSPPPSPAGAMPAYKLAQYRYGREEMLALYAPARELPDEFKESSIIVSEKPLPPLSLVPLSEDEQRLMSQSVNSSLVQRMMGRGSSAPPGVLRGRGGPAPDRGRGRGRGRGDGYYSRGFDEEGFGRGRGLRDWEEGPGGRFDRTFPPPGGAFEDNVASPPRRDFSRSMSSDNWRETKKEEEAGEQTQEDPGEWRKAPTRDRWGGRGGWRDPRERFDGYEGRGRYDDYRDRPPYERGRYQRTHSGSMDEGGDFDLPEWSTADVEGMEDLGTFDSSGAFMSLKLEGGGFGGCSDRHPKIKGSPSIARSISKEAEDGDYDQPKEAMENKDETGEPYRIKSGQSAEPREAQIPASTDNAHKSGSEVDTGKVPLEKVGKRETKSKPKTVEKLAETPPTAGVPANTRNVQVVHPNSVKNSQNGLKGPKSDMQRLDNGSVLPTPVGKDGVVKPEEEANFDHLEKAAENLVAALGAEEEKETLAPPVHSETSLALPLDHGDAKKWFYRDPQGDLQGPFLSSEMTEWFSAGYFTMNLLVKRGCDDRFQALGDLIKSWGRVPFIPGTSPPPQKNSPSVAPASNTPVAGPTTATPLSTTGQPLSTAAMAGQPLSIAAALAGQPLSTAAMAGQPLSTAAMAGQPLSIAAALAGQSLSTAAMAGQPLSTAAMPGQPLSTGAIPGLPAIAGLPAMAGLPAGLQLPTSMAAVSTAAGMPLTADSPEQLKLLQQHQQLLLQQQLMQQQFLRQQMQLQQVMQQLQQSQPEFASLSPQQQQQQALKLLMQQQMIMMQQQSQPTPPQVVPTQAQSAPKLSPRSSGQRPGGGEVPGSQEDLSESIWGLGAPASSAAQPGMLPSAPVPAWNQPKPLWDVDTSKAKTLEQVQQEELERLKREDHNTNQRRMEEEKRKGEERRMKEELERLERENEERLKRETIERIEQEKQDALRLKALERQRELERRQEMERQRLEQLAREQGELRRKQEEEQRRLKEIEEKRRSEEMRQHEEEMRRREVERQREQQEELMKEMEEKKRQEEIRRRQEKYEEIRRQQQRMKQELGDIQLPAKAQWGSAANSNAMSSSSQLSLTQIQQLEAERDRHEQEQRELQRQQMNAIQQQQQQQQQLQGRSWANAAQSAPSLLEIQQEQARQQDPSAKPVPVVAKVNPIIVKNQPAALPLATAAVWGGSTQQASANWAQEGAWGSQKNKGFWDDAVSAAAPPPAVHRKENKKSLINNNSHFPSLGSAPSANGSRPAVNKSKAKSNKDEETVQRLFQNLKPKDEFTQWCENALKGIQSNVDVPTFVAFLIDVESPYEVHDYARSYLGETRETIEFAHQFLEKRSKYKNHLRQQQQAEADIWGPAPAVNPRSTANSNQNNVDLTDDAKNAKKKKKKMQKVDHTFLGFTVHAAPDRINIGEIESTKVE